MKIIGDVFKDTKFTKGIEGMYMTPDVIAQRDKSFQMLGLSEGEKVLDIGVGPGFLSAAMGAMVGPGVKNGRLSFVCYISFETAQA